MHSFNSLNHNTWSFPLNLTFFALTQKSKEKKVKTVVTERYRSAPVLLWKLACERFWASASLWLVPLCNFRLPSPFYRPYLQCLVDFGNVLIRVLHLQCLIWVLSWLMYAFYFWSMYKKKLVVSRQPTFIVNLKSNTMKNTVQIYSLGSNCASIWAVNVSSLT